MSKEIYIGSSELCSICKDCPLSEECVKLPDNEKPPCAKDNFSLLCDAARRRNEEKHERAKYRLIFLSTILSILFILALISISLIYGPRYGVYCQYLKGQAILAHAQSSREVAVAEAKAKMESAYLLAAADTLRAQGVARANIIIGQSLTESYLKWFWISELKPGGQVVYVPTEANLPILEAGRKP